MVVFLLSPRLLHHWRGDLGRWRAHLARRHQVHHRRAGASGSLAARAPARLPPVVVVVAAILAGTVQRWWAAAHPMDTLTSDGAIIGLMVLRLLDHGQYPAYLFVTTSKTLNWFTMWCHDHDLGYQAWQDAGFTVVQPAVKVGPAAALP